MPFLTVPRVDNRGRVIVATPTATKPARQISKWCINIEVYNAAGAINGATVDNHANATKAPLKSVLKPATTVFYADRVTGNADNMAVPTITITGPHGATMEYVAATAQNVTFADKIRIAKIAKNNGTVDCTTKIENWVGEMGRKLGGDKRGLGGDGTPGAGSFELLCVRMEKNEMLRVGGGCATTANAAVKLSREWTLRETLGEVKGGSEVAMVEGFGKRWL